MQTESDDWTKGGNPALSGTPLRFAPTKGKTMAWLKSETAKVWPGFADWLRVDFIHVLSKTTVINAFYKWFRPPDDAPIPGITNNPDYHRLASNDEADCIERTYGNDEAPSYAFEREAYGRIMELPIQICNASNTDGGRTK
jgi:hypothetical protein